MYFALLCVVVQGAYGQSDRRLAHGNVHSDGSATYQICFRLSIPNPNLTLNPNPITDPNPNNKTKRHLNKVQHRVISKG